MIRINRGVKTEGFGEVPQQKPLSFVAEPLSLITLAVKVAELLLLSTKTVVEDN
jgi:hypothetical protein